MKLSEERRSAIYQAVHKEIVRLRVDLSCRHFELVDFDGFDSRIAQAGVRAATAAVKAAEGETE